MNHIVWKIHAICLTLWRVFHSIRFKVNKVGVRRYSFFYVRKLRFALFKSVVVNLPKWILNRIVVPFFQIKVSFLFYPCNCFVTQKRC